MKTSYGKQNALTDRPGIEVESMQMSKFLTHLLFVLFQVLLKKFFVHQKCRVRELAIRKFLPHRLKRPAKFLHRAVCSRRSLLSLLWSGNLGLVLGIVLSPSRPTRENIQAKWGDNSPPNGGWGGVLPEKLGGGVRPASQNPNPIYDQNLRYSLPYL